LTAWQKPDINSSKKSTDAMIVTNQARPRINIQGLPYIFKNNNSIVDAIIQKINNGELKYLSPLNIFQSPK
jgi:hypothetical protein